MYNSEYFCVATGKHTIYMSDIAEQDVDNLREGVQKLKLLLSHADYYLMVKDNCFDFLTDCQTNGVGITGNIIRTNRLLINSLNSYYVWEQYAHNNPVNISHLELIKQIKKTDVLQLADRIRHKGVHGSVPIEKMVYDSLAEKKKIVIDMESLFTQKEWGGFNKRIRDYITNSQLDAVEFIEDFLIRFDNLNNSIWRAVECDYQETVSELFKFVPNSCPDCFNSTIVNDETGERILIGRMLELVDEKYNLIIFNRESENNVQL